MSQTWKEAIDENIDWFPFDTEVKIIRNPAKGTPAITETRTRNNRIVKGVFTDKGRFFLWTNQFRQLVKIMENNPDPIIVIKTKDENRTVIRKLPTLTDHGIGERVHESPIKKC